LGVVEQTLFNWSRFTGRVAEGATAGRSDGEQMEISRLRAELARVTMERDILGKAMGTLRRGRSEVRLDSTQPAAWPIRVQCRMLGVRVAGYHEHVVRRLPSSGVVT